MQRNHSPQRAREHARKYSKLNNKIFDLGWKIVSLEKFDKKISITFKEKMTYRYENILVGEEICVCFGRKYRFGGWKRGAVLIIYRLDWIALGPALTKSIVKETSSSSPLLSSSPLQGSKLDGLDDPQIVRKSLPKQDPVSDQGGEEAIVKKG